MQRREARLRVDFVHIVAPFVLDLGHDVRQTASWFALRLCRICMYEIYTRSMMHTKVSELRSERIYNKNPID